MALWFITITNYQVNAYYPNWFPGDGFQNLSIISTVELIAYVLSGLAFDWFKGKQSTKLFIFSFSICIVGAIGIIINGLGKEPHVDMICNFICKFGIASCYQGVYLANILFPIVFASTTFGICCMNGAFAGLLSPYIYDPSGEKVYPWLIFIGLSLVGIIFALLLRDK